ncbi:uncharacterized protein LOC133387338 [Rhineura floridana]|uniref:uncharacterized protein LOC133387338 n=1 Tax=Rhineura floridana TaxID=261503 RepID=UPI002AC7FBC4|nr:uncharacterized protein LOC133387338 [Rhineura floridana]XP_061487892.1 uncharacterized protein LOC133387338 [Rhineura floridana]XP_061487893.1 uncharacterized protein LOC133387338 [Rhineura floridana]
MDKRTYHVCLVVSIIVQAVPLQVTDYLPLRNEDMPNKVTTHEARTAITSRTGRPTISSKAGNFTILYNTSNSWNTFATTVKTTNFPTPPQSTHSPHTEGSSPSDITAETQTEMTITTESFFSNSTYQATVKDFKVTTPAIILKPTMQPSRTAPLISKVLLSVSAVQFPVEGARLNNSEAILTIGFSIVLALTILGFIVYIFTKYRKRRDQFSHHPLYDASSETVDRYATPDDTLVISGGLYDAPRIYNSSMTVYEDDELQTDQLPFSAQPGQFRLKFLPGEKEMDLSSSYETFQLPLGSL